MHTDRNMDIPLRQLGSVVSIPDQPEEGDSVDSIFSNERSYQAVAVGDRSHPTPIQSAEKPKDDLTKKLPSQQLECLAAAPSAATSHPKRSVKLSKYTSMRHSESADAVVTAALEGADLKWNATGETKMEETIRRIPAHMSMKRVQMKKLSSKKKRTVGWWTHFRYRTGMTWIHFKHNMKEMLRFPELWRTPLKEIEGHFGTGVLTYFLFLKWLLLINIPTCVLTLAFVIIPQMLFHWHNQDPNLYFNQTAFSGIELLTGMGWFTHTEMYYGFYSTKIIQITDDHAYNIGVAYLFTCGGYYLLTIFILGWSILRSYRKFYIEASGSTALYHINKVLTGWDYGITTEEAAKLKQKGICIEMKEYLSTSYYQAHHQSPSRQCLTRILRILTNFVVLTPVAGAGYLIFHISDVRNIGDSHHSQKNGLSLLGLPVCVGAIHYLVPYYFRLIEGYEQFTQPKYQLYVHLCRSMLLRATTLGVLLYYWYKVARENLVPCWETFIGQEIYRLVIVDFIFNLLTTFFAEYIRRLIFLKFTRFRRAKFAIGTHTLELIYFQSLCWLGTFYLPMLSFIVIFMFVIIFYVKKTSVVQNCVPSLRPWRAARTHTIFLGFLFVFFMLAVSGVACGVVFIKPSTDCGLYQRQDTMYSVVTSLIQSWKDSYPALTDLINFVSSPGVIAAILIILIIICNNMRTMAKASRKRVANLKQQLALESKDKTFLLNLLKQVGQRRNVTAAPH